MTFPSPPKPIVTGAAVRVPEASASPLSRSLLPEAGSRVRRPCRKDSAASRSMAAASTASA